jgi:hypothetical protein
MIYRLPMASIIPCGGFLLIVGQAVGNGLMLTNERINGMMTPSKTAIERGMMAVVNGDPAITEAGLFALACQMAYAPNGEHENKAHCTEGTRRVLDVARAGGMEDQAALLIVRAFGQGFGAMDETDEGAGLASLCRNVVLHVGPGLTGVLLAGDRLH